MSAPRPSRPPAEEPMVPAASPLFLRDEELRRGLDLLHFGYGHLLRAADARLGEAGLGRAHHRALTFIARQPDLNVGTLLAFLGISKQALGRVLGELTDRGLVEARAGATDRRQKRLRLTTAGRALEAELFAAVRAPLARAYASAGQHDVTGFWRVLEGMVPPEDRALVRALLGPA